MRRQTSSSSLYRPDWEWLGRSLENYKSMHRDTAKNKGVEEQLRGAKTLTAARKLLFGMKRGNTK